MISSRPSLVLGSLLGAALLAVGSCAVRAADLHLIGTTDRESPLYEPGAPMTFRIRLEEGGRPLAGKRLVWTRTGDDGKSEKGEAVSGAKPLEIVTRLDQPGFVRILVTALDEAGLPLLADNKRKVVFDGGAGVQPETLKSIPEPADFDAYWSRQKERLAEVPLKLLEKEPLPSVNPKVEAFDVKIACAGDKPVSGYLFKTRGAGARSSGARVNFQGYGVRSATRDDVQASDPNKPMIVLTINAHGVANGQSAEFYRELEQTTLKNYGFNRTQNSDPDTAYFNGMILRVLRALEFVKAQPEWDGKTLIVSGGSKGAFQSLLAAGLDPDVTCCIADKPWLCDLGGGKLGRLTGWRPDYTAALGYYDPVNHAKRIRAGTAITAGLGDYICPPSGLSVLYNNIPDEVAKSIEYRQGATHGYNPPRMARHLVGNQTENAACPCPARDR